MSISSARAHGTESHDILEVLSGTFAESKLKDFSEPIDENEHAENYSYHSDSDLEDDEDAVTARKTTKKVAPPGKHTPDPLLFPANEKTPAPTYGERKDPPGKGVVIKIHDVAFITYVSSRDSHYAGTNEACRFQAFLMYLYTDSIEFAPFGSEDNRKSRSAEIVSLSEDSIPRPSPKSIYRLADKVRPLLTTMLMG